MAKIREKFNNFVRDKGNKLKKGLGDVLTSEIDSNTMRKTALTGMLFVAPLVGIGCSTQPKSSLDRALIEYEQSQNQLIDKYETQVDASTVRAINRVAQRLESYGEEQKQAFKRAHKSKFNEYKALIGDAHAKRAEVQRSIDEMTNALDDFEGDSYNFRQEKKGNSVFGIGFSLSGVNPIREEKGEASPYNMANLDLSYLMGDSAFTLSLGKGSGIDTSVDSAGLYQSESESELTNIGVKYSHDMLNWLTIGAGLDYFDQKTKGTTTYTDGTTDDFDFSSDQYAIRLGIDFNLVNNPNFKVGLGADYLKFLDADNAQDAIQYKFGMGAKF